MGGPGSGLDGPSRRHSDQAVGLTPRVALVTGAGRGLGRAIAERLAADGHTVVVAARSTAEVEAVAQAIRDAGGKAEARTLDVTDAGAAERLVADILRTHGRLEILVNSAGTSYIA